MNLKSRRIERLRLVVLSIMIYLFSDPQAVLAQNGFSFKNFNTLDSLNIVFDADTSSGMLRLTTATAWQKSSVWYTGSKQFIEEGFTTKFDFRISETGGLSPRGADGFAFVIQNTSDTASVGNVGGGLGYEGIPNSVAIEFDTWDNSEGSDNHISIQTGGIEANGVSNSYSIGFTSEISNLSSGDTLSVLIGYDMDSLKVYLEEFDIPVLSVKLNISDTLSLDNGTAWVGFTSATGAAWENHDILTWSFANKLGDTSIKDSNIIKDDFRISGNYPNPFSLKTTIHYDLSIVSIVNLKVFNMFGQEVRSLLMSEQQASGVHEVAWNGKDNDDLFVASGMYFYWLSTPEFIETGKMILIR